ncbi:hypothetical protein [Chitinimonas sp. JJ19]|uniref:hypothetical protein n=1 Tax=Chitinimonas sp. JJ19 TaxID=3109352 RepID=UPI001A39D3AE|nr:hypothetical protein [Chitinimonas sp.]
MRPEAPAVIAFGHLPQEQGALPEQIAKHQVALQSVVAPLSDGKARAMVALFGDDGCFGLAWSRLHLLETSPGWPLTDILTNTKNEWVVRLRQRAVARRKL